MELTTISAHKAKILETSSQVKSYVSEEDQINQFLDNVIALRNFINDVNDGYERLLLLVESLTQAEDLDSASDAEVQDILDDLKKLNTSFSRMFAQMNRHEVVRNGCNTVLLDLRINIRNLGESITDLEELFFLSEDDEELTAMLNDFAL